MVPRFLSLLAEPQHSGFLELAARLQEAGLHLQVEEPADWREGLEGLWSGQQDLAAVCGLLYTRLRARGLPYRPVATPVLDGNRFPDRPLYGPVLVARPELPIRSLEDLAGLKWVANEPGSYSGYRALLAALVREGLAELPLGGLEMSGSHENSLSRLRQSLGGVPGAPDFAVFDSTFWDALGEPARSGLVERIQLSPRPAPLLIAHQRLGGVEEALAGLGSPPAPFRRFVPTPDEAFDPLREDWNLSLEWAQAPQRQERFLLPTELVTPESFKCPELAVADQGVLEGMACDLLEAAQREPDRLTSNGRATYRLDRDGLQYTLHLLDRSLLESPCLSVVGFLSQLEAGIDLEPLFEADRQLVRRFHEFPGFISYSSQEYAPDQWANLAVFVDRQSQETWTANGLHQSAIAELSALYYRHIRLHLGAWPDRNAPLHFICTRYLDYSQRPASRSVRTYRPVLSAS